MLWPTDLPPMRAALLLPVAVLVVAQDLPGFDPVQPALFAAGGALVNAWADVDGDGDPDLFVGFSGTPNRSYRNDGGRFVDVAGETGLAVARATRAAAWGDVDADGDPDLVVGYAPGAGSVLELYRNDAGRFTVVTEAAGLAVAAGAVRQLAWVDVDGDGDLDLFAAFRDRENALFRNDAGRFTDEARDLGLADPRRTVGAVWFDYDEDDDLDLYVANMDGDANGLFRNDDGRFRDVAEAGLAWGGRAPNDPTNGTVRPCAADVDGDGRFDLVTANYGPNGLFLNRGGGRFEDVSAAWGLVVDGRHDTCAPADIDHDGRLDLYVNGTVTGGVSYRDFLFRQAGGRFVDATPENLRAFEASHGAQWADFDADGDLDLAISGTRPDATHSLLRNLLPAEVARRSIQVRVTDARGHARFPGAEACVFVAGTSRRLGCRLVDSGSGYNSQNALPVHVGLPDLGRIDVVVAVRQPGVREARWTDIDPAAHVGRALVLAVGRPAPREVRSGGR